MRRKRSCETRLAVRFATQPSGNSSRAFAMSSLWDSTWTPTPETLCGACPTISSTMSTSWIMRSNTTSMSSERGWNMASRWASMNLGDTIRSRTATSAGLKRSTCPTWSTSPVRRAVASSASASAVVTASGFSTSTWQPPWSAVSAAARCSTVGTAIESASTRPSIVSALENASQSCWAATSPISAVPKKPRSPWRSAANMPLWCLP